MYSVIITMDKLTIKDFNLIKYSLEEFDNSLADELLDKILTIEDWDLIKDSLEEFNTKKAYELVDKIKMLGLDKDKSDSDTNSNSYCYAHCGDADCASNY